MMIHPRFGRNRPCCSDTPRSSSRIHKGYPQEAVDPVPVVAEVGLEVEAVVPVPVRVELAMEMGMEDPVPPPRPQKSQKRHRPRHLMVYRSERSRL